MTEEQTQATEVADSAILEALLQRKEEGIRALLEKHGGTVRKQLTKFRFAREEDVDDAVSEACHRVWARIDSFDPKKGTLGSWFFVLARNCLFSALRVRRVHETGLVQGLSLDGLAGSAATTRSEAQEALISALHDCVEQLGDKQRSIILADVAAGETAHGPRLAEELGTTANSIHVSRHHAHNNLRKCLEAKGYKYE